MTFLKYNSNVKFIGKGAEYPVSFVKHTDVSRTSFLDGLSGGFEQSSNLAKLNSHKPEIIKMYLKMSIFLKKSLADYTI